MPFVETNGARLHYEVHGSGEPVLLIHGLGSRIADWENQIDALAPAYQVIAFDLRDHGDSEKPPGPFGIPMFAADAAELLETLGIRSAHIVGWSLGGAIAFQLAVDFPARVRSLVIVNSAPEFALGSMRARIEFGLRRWISHIFSMRFLGRLISWRLFPGPQHRQLRRKFVSRWARNDSRSYRAALRALAGWSVRKQAAALACPVTVISAEHDYIPFPLQQQLTAEIRGARLVRVPGARHGLPAEQPAVLSNLLIDAISRATSPSAGG